ncbi:MAG: DNA polymerase III subunit delta [Chitinophagales bacterium]|jgi:DNA polymerase III subunit delta|nr:DNA polymerase III subunit delta [Chitinophagales bacterium]
MALSAEDIIGQIKKGAIKPVYFLAGEEAYYIDEITHFAEENLISEAERSFNQVVFYGKETNWRQLLEALNRFPMMAARQVVVLREAQDFKDWDELENYFNRPVPSTVFLIAYKSTIDKRRKFAKTVTKSDSILYFESNPIKEWDIENWMKQYVAEKGYKISTVTAAILKEYLGTQLQVIVNELSKLMLNVPKGKEITAEDIEKWIGISKEFNVFELTKSLGARDVVKAQKFVHYCRANAKSNPLPMVIGTLYTYFSKLYLMSLEPNAADARILALAGLSPNNRSALMDYRVALRNYPMKRVERALSLLQEYDLKFKGVNNVSMDEGQLLQEMVIKILQ